MLCENSVHVEIDMARKNFHNFATITVMPHSVFTGS